MVMLSLQARMRGDTSMNQFERMGSRSNGRAPKVGQLPGLGAGNERSPRPFNHDDTRRDTKA